VRLTARDGSLNPNLELARLAKQGGVSKGGAAPFGCALNRRAKAAG